jgi:predicted  nucleic acid-binding Zn-ribbon protein
MQDSDSMNTKRRENCQLRNDWKERIIRIGDEQTSLQNQFDNFRNEYGDYPALIEGLETTVNGFDGRLIIAESDIANAENRISECENDIDSLESEVNSLDGRVTITETDISAAETRITACENDIDSLEGGVNALDGRVSITESDISDAESRITACESDIESLETEVNSLDGRVSITETDISTAKNRISACENDIDSLEGEVNALDGRVTTTETDISAAESRISACENDIDRIDAELVNKTGEINNLSNRLTIAEGDIDYIDARLDGIETGEILLSQLNVDADKDMAGKALSNVKIDANEVTVKGSPVEPTQIFNLITLYDMHPRIRARNIDFCTNADLLEYGNDEMSPDAPHSEYVLVTNYHYSTHNNLSPQNKIAVIPGEKLYIEVYAKREVDATGEQGGLRFGVHCFDKDFRRINPPSGIIYATDYIIIPTDGEWHRYVGSVTIPTSHTPTDGSDGGPVRYIEPEFLWNHSAGTIPTKIGGYRIYRDANFVSDLTAKIISADGVIIKDGGTVDGVDISTHTHDGTAIGGPKISYNDLVDKPTLATFASSNYKYYHDDEVQVSSTTMTKAKTFTFSKAGVTNARVYFELKGPTGVTGFAEVRKNGILIGTRQSQVGGEYGAKTQDLDLNISAGDTIELWCRTASTLDAARVRNFRIGYDIGMDGIVTIS